MSDYKTLANTLLKMRNEFKKSMSQQAQFERMFLLYKINNILANGNAGNESELAKAIETTPEGLLAYN